MSKIKTFNVNAPRIYAVVGMYNKATVHVYNGIEILYSYETPIMLKKGNTYYRLIDSIDPLSNTTMRHVRAFWDNNIHKKDIMALPLAKIK